jgi:formate hydrogenlyase subunit 3/multisubunit Na+/H+ antiporter MnhD subunit
VSAEHLPILVPLLPLIGAVGAFALPRAARGLGLVVMVVLLPLTARLATQILDHGPLLHVVGGWAAPLGVHLRADGLAAILLLALSTVGLLVSLYAHSYFGPTTGHPSAHTARYFWPLWLFLVAALGAMFVSGDVFNLYVCLELASLAAVALVSLAGSTEALRAALRYLFVSLTGSLLYLLGVALLYGAYATLDLGLLALRVEDGPHALLALTLMTGGLVMKAALFPMHFWLPPAHSSAPAPVSAALSALVVKGSFYILLRLWFEAFSPVTTGAAAQWIGGLGAVAILWGSLLALLQRRLKLLIAYSTVAQVGYLFLLVPLAWNGSVQAWTGGLLMLLAHATAKAAMFLAAGTVQRATGDDRIDGLAGLTRLLPISVWAMGLAAVSLVGLPPTAGFMGKWLLIGASLEQGQWWWVLVMLCGSLLAAAYVMRVLRRAFSDRPEATINRAPPLLMEWSALALALISFLLGFVAHAPARLVATMLAPGGAP